MKRSTTWNRLLSVVLAFAMLLSLAAPAMAAENDGISFTKVDNSNVGKNLLNREEADVTEDEPEYDENDVVRVSIFLEKKGTIEAGYAPMGIAANSAAMSYRDSLKREQVAVTQKIENAIGEELDVVWNLTLATNLISANVKFGMIEKIAAVKGVEKVVIETQYSPDVVTKGDADPNMATSGKQTGSTAAWAAGYTGAGSKIAIIDTGLDVLHEAFDPDAFEYSLAQLDGEYDLMTAASIEAVLSELHIAELVGANAEDLYVNSKVPFAFSYVDGDLEVGHNSSEHGSHVAGIAAANAYVKAGETFKPALETTCVQGVAPDAQLLVMQVFGDNGGAWDSDYMAAIEDAIVLGADSVNLSLGSGNPGFTFSADYQAVMDSLTESGVVVVISAGNSGCWPAAAENGIPYLYLDDVSMHTGGSPGTFTNSLGVASVNNDGAVSNTFQVGGYQIGISETDYSNEPLATLAGEREFVFIDGVGTEDDWAALGDAVTGKVAFCSRGTTSFYEKANAAVAAGAIAVVIYNNQDGIINMDLTGYEYTAPVVSITQAGGMMVRAAATEQDGYFTGTMTISDGPAGVQYNSDYYTMSSFSSWGVPGSLTMKPEITAPGGGIYSVAGYVPGVAGTGHSAYEVMDGTSMAAPQVAGMVAVLTQYFRESGLAEQTGLDARVLAQSLLMSTAVPMVDGESGCYYSVLQQGAGLGNVGNAVAAESYILMGKDATASYADGKVKAELGDDPDRTGKYTFTFTINNITDEAQTYTLDADVFTQDAFAYNNVLYMDTWTALMDATVTWKVNGEPLFAGEENEELDINGDGEVNEADGQAILDFVVGNLSSLANQDLADLDGNGKVTTYDAYLFFNVAQGDAVVVDANGTVTVEVTIALSEAQKEFLDTYYTGGAYVEAYVYANSVTDSEGVIGTSHSIPVLGFYGSWTDASMFDKGSFVEYYYGLENRAPYLYSSNLRNNKANALYITYADEPNSVYFFGGNPVAEEDTYMPERNALSTANGDMISKIGFSLIRSAGTAFYYVKNTDTGEYLGLQPLSESGVVSAYYHVNAGAWKNTFYSVGTGFTGAGIAEGTSVEVGVIMVPEYYQINTLADLDKLGEGAFFSMPMVIDNTAPTIVENGLKLSDDESTLTLTIEENQYVAAVALLDSAGTSVLTYTGSNADAEAGETLQYTLDLSEVAGNGFLLQVFDYAYNCSTYEVDMQLGELVDTVDSVTVTPTELIMQKATTASLSAVVAPLNASDRSVTWTSSDESVATVDADGVVTAVGKGNATITATAVLDNTKSAACAVEVIDISTDLNAIVWDEQGSIWYSEFNTATLPNYTKLSKDLLEDDYFVAATIGQDYKLYASTLNTSNGTGTLYTMDPETYAVTELADCVVQGIDIFYSDLTYVPAMFGTGVLLGSYGPFVIAIDAETGVALEIIDEYDSEIVGITTCYGLYDEEQGVYQDVVYVILNDGTVIQEIYYGYDGLVVPYMDYFYGYRASMPTGVSVGDAWYFNSAYYDGEYLYWSAFNQNTDDYVSLYAIDADVTGNVYSMGQFAESVWPVGGLHEKAYLEAAAVATDKIAEVQYKQIAEVQQIQLVKQELEVQKAAQGSLNAISDYQAPVKPQAADTETVTVSVTAKDAEGVEVDSTNGLVTVTYDPSQVTLVKVTVNGDYTAVKTEEGSVTFAYVGLEAIPAGAAVAELEFENKATKDTEITIKHEEVCDEEPGYEETVVIKAKEELVVWHSASTTLSGNIGLNFYVKLADKVVNDASTYMHFTFADKTLDVPMSEAFKAEDLGENIYRFTCPVTSKNMTDKVTAQVMNADGAVGEAKGLTVATYCNYMINSSKDAELVALMKAMLNYGAAAQILFDHNTDNLANAALSAEDKVLADVDASAYAHKVTGAEDGIKLSQATLLLNSNTNVRVYYKLTGDKTIDQYTFTINGEEVTPVEKDGEYYIEVVGVSAHKLDEMYTFTVGGLTLKFGAMSFVNMVMSAPETAGEALVNTAKALTAYSKAVEAYRD